MEGKRQRDVQALCVQRRFHHTGEYPFFFHVSSLTEDAVEVCIVCCSVLAAQQHILRSAAATDVVRTTWHGGRLPCCIGGSKEYQLSSTEIRGIVSLADKPLLMAFLGALCQLLCRLVWRCTRSITRWAFPGDSQWPQFEHWGSVFRFFLMWRSYCFA